ncbi:hypothetical protein Gohar_026162 [Gossypium harknessii]|uniref:Uncharacterized protein n=1 Tax=Gossypium harknessii TaxID=34285 RepID=A0A7J9HR30_9ROSI|nr:hypothetical protein [Gossypium harknessii]
MFQVDIDSFGSNGRPTTSCSSSSSFASSSSSFASYGESSGSNKRNSADMSSGETMPESGSSFNVQFHGFCVGVEHKADMRQQRGAKGGMVGGAGSSRRRNGRKQKVSSGHDVSSNDCRISGS